MEIIHDINEINIQKPCAVALGAFDGLHLGHQKVIEAAVRAEGLTPCVFSFEENPHGGTNLITAREKRKILERMEIRCLISVPFEDVREMEAEPFAVDILLNRCGAKKICCGEDFRFGKSAAGTIQLLRGLCDAHGTELAVVPPVELDGERISSTQIRAAIEAGDMRTANRMLGRPFSFSFEVIHGNHIGTGLGMPTINQALPENFVLPRFGVYASYAKVGENSFYHGVTNIGVKPTVGSDSVLSETWMPAYS